jgi:hypothetical protein
MQDGDSAAEDADGNLLVVTLCDRCGRTEDQLDVV